MERSSRFARLRKRLNAATSQRGKKSELARYLNVPPARVLEWLAGLHEPGAEVTLRMLEWVTAQEANHKPKTPGSATNTARGRQTRSQDHRHETKKQVRKSR